jgi:hypothetical protein
MKRLLMVTAAALALITADANAENLQGTWSFVGNDNCLMSNSPINLIPGASGDFHLRRLHTRRRVRRSDHLDVQRNGSGLRHLRRNRRRYHNGEQFVDWAGL